jgi:hypothetical protein
MQPVDRRRDRERQEAAAVRNARAESALRLQLFYAAAINDYDAGTMVKQEVPALVAAATAAPAAPPL